MLWETEEKKKKMRTDPVQTVRLFSQNDYMPIYEYE